MNNNKGQVISLPTHRLWYFISGPERPPNTPIVIILPGVGTSVTEWAAVHRLLHLTHPTLLYERAGIGQSDESPYPPTATRIAAELDQLLAITAIAPPYVIVCHSYGGITSREFLDLLEKKGRGEDVVGMVFVDANQEKSIQLWPDPVFNALGKGLDTLAVTGVAENRALSDEEWDAMLVEKNTAKHQRAAQREMERCIDSCKDLGRKNQLNLYQPLLGFCPISILKGNAVRDHERIYCAGVEAGNGTDEERRAYREKLKIYGPLDERFQRETASLSEKHRLMRAERSGHNVHLTEPEAIVREVCWVMDNLRPCN